MNFKNYSSSVLLFILTRLGCPIFAQNLRGGISGLVWNEQNKPLAGTVVTLKNEADTTVNTTQVAGQDGSFVFGGLPTGSYVMGCSYIGFQSYRLSHLVLDAAHPLVRLPVIVLQRAAGQSLKEVIISAKKPLIEQKTDRTVVNVDAMILAAGSSALEALGKSPGVYVDANGNIELNGQGGVLVLIDDKQTYLSAADLAAYLRSLPASILDKIELMSNPPARYDASGSAVINLQLKKNQTAGFNGNVSLSYLQGHFARSNDALNINYRTKKYNIFANLSYSHDAKYTTDDGNRYFFDNSGTLNSVIQLNSQDAYTSNSWNGRAGMDFFASPNTTLGFVLTGGVRPRNELFFYSSDQYNGSMQLDSADRGYTQGNYQWTNEGANLNFLHKFNADGHRLSADMDYIRYSSNGSQLSPSNFYSSEGDLTGSSTILNQTPSTVNIYAAKTDYTLPLGGKVEFDAGLKSSLVNTDNVNNWINQSGDVFVPDFLHSNHFIYKENINAAYVSTKKEWQRWGLQLGMRMENTNASGHQVGNVAVADSTFTKNYTSVFPGVFLSHKLDSAGNNTLVLSYSIRVRRPNYQQLDPFLYYQNPYTFSAGNPGLIPAYNHIIQLKYTFKQYFGLSIAYLHIGNGIYNVTQNTAEVFISRPENFSVNNSINFNAYANISPVKGWDLNANFLVYNLTNKGNVFGQYIDERHTTGEIELSNEFQFSHGWSAELNYFYHGPGNGGQTNTSSLWTISAGIQKKIGKGKCTIRLKAEDIFHTLQNHQTTLSSGANYIHTSESDTQQVGLSLSYHFGKAANARKRDDNGSAEDEKGRTN